MSSEFLNAYIQTALWSSTDQCDDTGGYPLEDNYSAADIAPEALERMKADCEAFVAHSTVAEYLESDDYVLDYRMDLGVVAYDFWLTRNRHGAGFWGGDYPEPWGDRLTEAAHSFGECNLYVGDDKLIYCE